MDIFIKRCTILTTGLTVVALPLWTSLCSSPCPSHEALQWIVCLAVLWQRFPNKNKDEKIAELANDLCTKSDNKNPELGSMAHLLIFMIGETHLDSSWLVWKYQMEGLTRHANGFVQIAHFRKWLQWILGNQSSVRHGDYCSCGGKIHA